MPPAHAACLAMLAPVMTMREGGRIYSPGGRVCSRRATGSTSPGSSPRSSSSPTEGARTFYEGTLAEALLALDGGARRPRHPRTTWPRTASQWLAPVETDVRGRARPGRGGLSQLVDTLRCLAPAPRRGARPSGRSPSRASSRRRPSAAGRRAHDEPRAPSTRDGNACVRHDQPRARLGRLPPGLDVHLNSMLGEADLLIGPLEAGERMESMMSPTVALDDDGLVARRRRRRRHAPAARARPGARRASSTRALPPRRRSTARACTPPASRPHRARLRRRRAIEALLETTATTCASGASSTTTSAASALARRWAADPRRSGAPDPRLSVRRRDPAEVAAAGQPGRRGPAVDGFA